jgi:glycosyltransferase involved in cell wall biosynthesis
VKRRVLFVVPSLGLGGVERALIAVLERLDRTRFEPVLAILGDQPGEANVPSDVRVVTLGRRSKWSFGRVVVAFRKLIRTGRFDCVVTFSGTANFVALLAAATSRSAPPIVVTEHIAPLRMYGSAEETFGWLKKLLIRFLYPRAASVVAVSQGVADELGQLGVPNRLLRVVHTPVELASIAGAATADVPNWPQASPVVVSVGRMTLQKNHRLLLEAIALLRPRLPVSLVLVGDGPLRPELEAASREHELDVVFAGADTNPYRFMARADAFALTSDFEGFGVVIVEALALGVPVVSTDCPSGPREILGGGAFGVLTPVGDAQAFADALYSVMTNEELAASLGAAGPERANAFSSEHATRALEAVVEAVTRHGV